MSIKTCFVIGAGASCDANLPTGEQLKRRIVDSLGSSPEHINAFMAPPLLSSLVMLKESYLFNTAYNFDIALNSMLKGLPLAISIDNFIDAHKGNKSIEILGKLCIAYEILKAERDSNLSFQYGQHINFNDLSSSWYGSFFKLLFENCKIEDLEQRLESISLIIFNYDRCLEQFLIHAISYYYYIPYEQAYILFSKIELYHPYGSLGPLPKYPETTDSEFTSYGGNPDYQTLINIVSKLRTFTEGTDPNSSQINAIHECIAKSKRLVFIGFAYHRQNLELLTPNSSTIEGAQCFGTTFGISVHDEAIIRKQIASMKKIKASEVKLTSGKCNDLFFEYGKALSFL